MKLSCFVSALAFVVLLPDSQFLILVIIVVVLHHRYSFTHVHKDIIWCEIYILAHHSAGLIHI